MPYRYPILLSIPLVLSCFTHMWNLTGFPAIYMDEDIYLRKALHALQGLPLEPDKTNPMYGWLFLTLFLKAVGYPNSLNPTANTDVHSIETLYLVPRIFIGLLAILDTFLIFKIAEYYFKNRTVAFLASIFFAVMPMTWLTRYVILESIQLPFILSSILLAILADSKINNGIRPIWLIVIFSGICLGSAIFIKIPAITLIPLVGFIIYKNCKSVKLIALWFIPVLLIPLISPTYANYFGMFNTWKDGIFYQANRGNQPLFDPTGKNPSNAINALLKIDPFLIIVGIISIIFIAVRRDFLVLLWTMPYIIFFYLLGYVSFFHFIPLLPAFCIALAMTIVDLSTRIRKKGLGQILPYAVVTAIGIFGLMSTILLVTSNLNLTHFEAAAILASRLPIIDNNNAQQNRITVIMGESRFLWILEDIFHKDHIYKKYWDHASPINKTKGVLLVVEGTYNYWKRTDGDKNHVRELVNIYNDSRPIVLLKKTTDIYDTTKYPFTSMSIPNLGIGKVELRANTPATNLFLNLLNHGK